MCALELQERQTAHTGPETELSPAPTPARSLRRFRLPHFQLCTEVVLTDDGYRLRMLPDVLGLPLLDADTLLAVRALHREYSGPGGSGQHYRVLEEDSIRRGNYDGCYYVNARHQHPITLRPHQVANGLLVMCGYAKMDGATLVTESLGDPAICMSYRR